MATATPEVALPAAILLLALAMFFAIQYLPKHPHAQHRAKDRTAPQSNRHLVQGNHLLSRAKSLPRGSRSQTSLAKSALSEAETAISLSPKDPAPLLLRALALDLLGHNASALKAVDSALYPPRAKSLSRRDRADALVKRAELKMAINRRRRVDSAIEDLKEAAELLRSGTAASVGQGDMTRVFCQLGHCYEFKGLRDEAKRAFGEALQAQPDSITARQGLNILGS